MRPLRDVRAERLFSIRGLAAAAGVSQVTVQNIEAGRHTPQPTTIRKLAKALDVAPRDVAEFANAIEAVQRGKAGRAPDFDSPEGKAAA